MLTHEQIAATPEAELVSAVAELVMPDSVEWVNCFKDWCIKGTKPAESWEPLDNWNHTHMVIDAMRAKGWFFEIVRPDDQNGIWNGFTSENEMGISGHRVKFGNERRAILEAALLAVQLVNAATEKGR